MNAPLPGGSSSKAINIESADVNVNWSAGGPKPLEASRCAASGRSSSTRPAARHAQHEEFPAAALHFRARAIHPTVRCM